MAERKVKLADVAKAAGVSRAAAGKILNHCQGAIRVGEDARKRIEEVAAKLNYHNNLAAAMLAGKKSSLVGVMIDSHSQFRRQQMLLELETAATARNLRLFVGYTHENFPQMEENLRAMDEYGVLGVLCLCHDYYWAKPEITAMFRNRKKTVFFEEPFFDGSCYVKTDDTQGLTQMIAALKKDGIKRIVCLYGNTKSYTERVLVEQFSAALAANGIKPSPEYFAPMALELHPLLRSEHIVREVLVPRRPQVVFADDAHYVICMKNLLAANYPELLKEITFFGGNNDPLFTYLSPVVRSLDPDYSTLAEAMLDALENGCPPGCAAVVPSIYHLPGEKNRKVQVSCAM